MYDPAPEFSLLWSGAAQGLVLGVDAKQIAPILGNAPIQAELPCDAATIPIAPFAPRGFPKARWIGQATDSFTLAASPGGPPAATFPVGPLVSVIDVKGTALHVTFENGDGVWHGWAEARAFIRTKELGGQGFGTGTGRLTPMRFPGVDCPADVPLFVRKAGEPSPLALVGMVRARMHVAFMPPVGADSFRVLGPEQRANSDAPGSLMVLKGLELVVATDAVATCAPALR